MNLKVLYELVDDGQRQLFVSVDDGRCTCESLDIVLSVVYCSACTTPI